jgi:hypothetical protein
MGLVANRREHPFAHLGDREDDRVLRLWDLQSEHLGIEAPACRPAKV